MADIFISYAREDQNTVKEIVAALDYDVWWDRNILPGATFDEVIDRELAVAKAIIVVWSNASVKSRWVREEASYGAERGNLIPVSIDDVAAPRGFKLFQTANLSNWAGEHEHEQWQLVVSCLENLCGSLSDAEQNRTSSTTNGEKNVETDQQSRLEKNQPGDSNVVELFRAHKSARNPSPQFSSDEFDGLLSQSEIAVDAGDAKAAERLLTDAVERFCDAQSPWVARGLFMFDRKRWREAAHDLEHAINMSGEADGSVWVYFAESLVQLGELDEALSHFNQLIEQIDDYSAAYYYRGLCHFALGNDEKGLDDLDRAILCDSTDPDPLVARASYYFENQSYEAAHKDLLRAHTINPDEPTITYHLARVLAALGECELALANFESVMETDPDLPGLHCAFASLMIDRRKIDEAEQLLETALQSDPSDAAAHVQVGRLNIEQGNWAEAESSLRRAIELAPDTRQAHHFLGQALAHSEKWHEAEQAFTKSLSLGENKKDILLTKGWAYHNQGLAEEALATFRQLVELDSTNSNYLTGLGFALLLQTGSLLAIQEAVQTLSEALEGDPNEVYAFSGRALGHFILRDYSRALVDVDAALSLDPNAEQMPQYRAMCLVASGEIKEAAQYLATFWSSCSARGQEPDAMAYTARARLRFADHKLSLADVDAERAVVADPNNDEARLVQGDIRMASGNFPGALEAYEAADEIYPDYPPFLVARARALIALRKRKAAIPLLRQAQEIFSQTGLFSYLQQEIDQLLNSSKAN